MKRVYDGFNKIDIIEVEMKGRLVKREKLILPDAVAGLVVNQNGEMAIVHQFRPSIASNSMEIPAGILDKKLTNVQILHEELYEECGIDPSDIVYTSPKPIDKYYINIGSSDAVIELYLVRVKNVKAKRVKVKDPDVDFVSWKTLAEMQELSDNGKLRDPKTIIAFNFFKEMMLTPPTDKQAHVIDIIALTTGKVFEGKTLEEARIFIANNIEESKRIARTAGNIGFTPAHSAAYSIVSQMEQMERFLKADRRAMPDIDIDFEPISLPKCVNCGQQYHNDHANLCSDCYDLDWGTLGDVTGEPQNNGHYGMPDQGDVGEGAFFDDDTKFVGGGLDRDDEEDPDVGF